MKHSRIQIITAKKTKSILRKIGFVKRHNQTIHLQIIKLKEKVNKLDKEAQELLGAENAEQYYNNRKKCWEITSKIIELKKEAW